ncbi:MAG: hypothetical protein IKX91_00995, partial [Firmicutes bacterium]|nr:hypothetical protein [Bacillota bacterium]
MDERTLGERLIANVESGRVPHAVILEGPRALTEPAARLYAKALLCTGEGRKPCGRCASCRNLQNGIEEDLILLDGAASGKSGNRALKDERVAAMQDALKKKPLASDRIVALILEADLLTERAQNRLLKTLEEPPGRDALILLSENTRHLLPTILSRCQLIKAGGGNDESADDGRIRELAKAYWKLAAAGVPYYEYLPILKAVAEDKPTADAFLDAFEECAMEAV